VGGFGEVFYGKFPNGQEVGIKTLSTSSHQSKLEFFNEISFHNSNFFTKRKDQFSFFINGHC
jgi:hypothetical protein